MSDSAASPVPVSPGPRRKHHVPDLVFVVVLVITIPLASLEVSALATYYVAHTTVSIDFVSRAIPEPGGGAVYSIECQYNCPQAVAPGFDYSGVAFISGYFEDTSVSLVAPLPFRLVSTDPLLPIVAPILGVDITVDLGLPSAPGEYAFTGNVTFG